MGRHRDGASELRTAAELARDGGAKPPVGEFLYKLTRQVRFPSPVTSIRGRFRGEGVYCGRGETIYYRSCEDPADPRTPAQLEQRAGFGGSQADWKNLTPAERDGWSAYGARYFAEEHSSSPGPNVYTKAHSCRRGWGETALVHTPPVLAPPPQALRLEELPSPVSGQVAFRVEHDFGAAAGYRIELRMTPAMINFRKPQEPMYRRAGATAPESFFPLQESGAVYLLERPWHAVAAGQRFGLGVRLITPEGIPGPELCVDLVRKEALEGEGVTAEMGEGGETARSVELNPGPSWGVAIMTAWAGFLFWAMGAFSEKMLAALGAGRVTPSIHDPCQLVWRVKEVGVGVHSTAPLHSKRSNISFTRQPSRQGSWTGERGF